MQPAALTPDEAHRVALLSALCILDTPPEVHFDRLAALASRLLDVPIALISLVDGDRHWFKSRIGLDVTQTPSVVPFCRQVLSEPGFLIVADASTDARFADNPLVTGVPGVRFCAGLPIHSAEGVALGTLCVLDHRPRVPTAGQQQLLTDLAAIASREIFCCEMAMQARGCRVFQSRTAPNGDRSFTYAASDFAELVDATPDSLIEDADRFWRHIHPEDRPRFDQHSQDTTIDAPYSVRYRLIRPDGRGVIWCDAHLTVQREPDGGTLRSGYVADVTEGVEMQRKMQENERLQVAATLATGMAHDFNNILGSMMGLADLCLDQAEAGSKMHRNLTRILSSGRKAAALIRRLLDFSRQTDRVLSTLRLGALTRNAEDLLSAVLPAQVDLQIDVRSDGIDLMADEVQIEQLLLSLVTNAGYAMREDGGCVRVVVDALDAAASPLKTASMRLRVIDTGCGIAPADLPHVFEPFFTTKPVGEGVGLGLASCYGIVAIHLGQIRAESTPGEGSVFTVVLPQAVSVAGELPRADWTLT